MLSYWDIIINVDPSLVSFEVFNVGGDINNFTKMMIVEEVLKHIPEAKVKYGANGSDQRNFKVSFSKINNVLGFKPNYTVQDGILQLIEAFRTGAYHDLFTNKNKYGNYVLNPNKK